MKPMSIEAGDVSSLISQSVARGRHERRSPPERQSRPDLNGIGAGIVAQGSWVPALVLRARLLQGAFLACIEPS
jgi:hypothetical protein